MLFKQNEELRMKKLFLEERLPRGFEITNVISVKEDGGRLD